MNLFKTLRLNKLLLIVGLFMFSSMVAISDTSEDLSGASSFSFSTDLIVYGLVGSNILGAN
jgi:hypothetical protein